MSKARRFPAIVVLLLGSSLLLPVPAHAVELTGAWANQADLCKLVFTKKGNGVVFAELSDLSLKVIDDNNLARRFPTIEGMEIKYTRCAL
jgi:hypothetical protein